MSDENDILIINALIVDGTGKQSYKGTLSVKDERITEISNETLGNDAKTIIDANGFAVTPGFIDVHNHGDLSILYYPKAEGFLHQGITTFIGGHCGDSPGPFGEWIGLPWVLKDIYTDINPKMYSKDWLQPRDLVNKRHKEVFGWKIDWNTMAEFFQRLSVKGHSPNYVPLVGHGDIRSLVMGPDFERHATEKEIKEMVVHTVNAMEEGCIGISVGRDYDPGIWAGFDEILACAKVVARYGGIYCSHSLRTGHRKPRRPGEFPPIKTEGVLEAIDIGRKAKIPVQISHLGLLYDIAPTDDKELMKEAIRATLRIIDNAREEGIDVNFDEIPHHLTGGISTSPWLVHTLSPWLAVAGSPEQLAKALQMSDFRDEMKSNIWAGKHYGLNPNINRNWASVRVIAECKKEAFLEKTVAQIANEYKIEELDALFRVIIADPYTKVERRGDDDWMKLEFYKHPEIMVGIDTFAVDLTHQSWHHPPSYPNQNSYGGFACYLKRSIREAKIMSIEEAVRKITSSPARKFNLNDRGVLKKGGFADIVVWDPATIKDKGSQLEPRQFPEGIHYVLVNGKLVIQGGIHTGALPGKILTRN